MSNQIIDRDLIEVQADIDQLFHHLHQLTMEISNESMSETIKDIRSKLNEPFLFVIVGEVKAGKSSFVNALLDTGRDICKVAPDPCTDIIQQIMYSEDESIEDVNEHLKKIRIPVPILEKISIVDTPGTNTIIDHHQEITERFVPHSDLIVFVFEAKNPYRQSAWEFFDYISKEWRKKVIFILQQKDLMTPENLTVNIQGVRNHAIEKGIESPRVFAVSALQEREGKKDISGFKDLREFIVDNITGGDAFRLKMQSNVSTGRQILTGISEGMEMRKQQLKADHAFRDEIREAMDDQEQKSFERVDKMVQNLLQDYDRITGNVRKEFLEGLNFFSLASRSVRSVFSSNEKSVKEWLTDLTRRLEKELRTNFQTKLEDSMTDISDSIKTMVKLVDLKMKNNQTILPTNHEIFGEIAEKRQDAIKAIQKNYSQFVDNTENFIDEEIFPKAKSYAPDVAAGGGLAVIGAILAASSHTLVFDITGGIIAGLGLLFAGVTLFFRKRQVVQAFDEEIAKGRRELEKSLDEQVKAYTTKIKTKLDQNFDPFDIHVKREEKELIALDEKVKNLQVDINEISAELGTSSL